MNYAILGFAIASFLLAIFVIFLLYKKNTTENNIQKLNQKNKRNKGSNIDNDITTTLPQEDSSKRRKRGKDGILKRIFTKRKTK